MDNTAPKTCPFGNKKCSKECGLYIDPSELNEVVRNKLASIGVINRDEGLCSIKNISLCMSRIVYEGGNTYSK